MKKILFLSTGLDVGGAETELVRVVISLKARGWDIKIVSMRPLYAYADELREHGISVETLNMRRGRFDIAAFIRFIKILRSEKPDILNTVMVHANFWGRLTRLFARVPVLVSSAHNITEGGTVRGWWYRTTDFLCDMTTQVSKTGLRRYIENRLVPASKIVYIPNGIDTEKFKRNDAARTRLRRESGLENAFVWLAVGRIEKAKDYVNMINAFSSVHGKAGSVLLIAGRKGPAYREVEDLVKRSGVDGAVRFLGVRTDIADLMSASDAYVMSSAWEGAPIVLLEAASCELPIVTTAVGENPALVLNGVTGFVVPSKSPEKLAKAMDSMMNLPAEDRLRMGQESRKHIKKEYGLTRTVDTWERLYLRLLEKK